MRRKWVNSTVVFEVFSTPGIPTNYISDCSSGFLFYINFVIQLNSTGVQYLSEAMVAMQRFQQLLDLPNGHGITNPDEQDKVTMLGVSLHSCLFVK